jgi:hypothetical protein
MMYPYGYPPSMRVSQQEIIRVNGRNGAMSIQMAPSSSVLVLDETAPLVWLCQTDGAGYLTVTPFDIAPHQEAPQVSVNDLSARLARLEEIVNGKSDAAPSESE